MFVIIKNFKKHSEIHSDNCNLSKNWPKKILNLRSGKIMSILIFKLWWTRSFVFQKPEFLFQNKRVLTLIVGPTATTAAFQNMRIFQMSTKGASTYYINPYPLPQIVT